MCDEKCVFKQSVNEAIEALSAETPTIQEKHQLSEVDTPTDLISREETLYSKDER